MFELCAECIMVYDRLFNVYRQYLYVAKDVAWKGESAAYELKDSIIVNSLRAIFQATDFGHSCPPEPLALTTVVTSVQYLRVFRLREIPVMFLLPQV
jgi:hypothetical protein